MIIDSSALLAVVLDEPESHLIAEVLADTRDLRMSAVNWLESMMVLESRHAAAAAEKATALLNQYNVEIIPFDQVQMRTAQDAWRRFGKGNHPAGLNLADCCAYAAALTSGEPLLYKGDDFSKTDIDSVNW